MTNKTPSLINRAVCASCALLLGFVLEPSRAQAGILDFLTEYHLGAEVGKEVGTITAVYTTSADLPLDPQKCNSTTDGKYQCAGTMKIEGGYSPAVTFATAFKRKGLLHYDLDLDFAIRRVATELTRFDADMDLAPVGYAPPPLRQMGVTLYGVNADAYFEFGLTPAGHLPDLIFAVGIGIQPLYGTIQLNNTVKRQFILNSLFYAEINLVLLRFGKGGEIALYAQGEAGDSGLGSLVVDGMNNFDLQMSKKSYGLSILTNMP